MSDNPFQFELDFSKCSKSSRNELLRLRSSAINMFEFLKSKGLLPEYEDFLKSHLIVSYPDD